MARSPHNRGLTAKHPRRAAGLVEDCLHLTVPDVLARLTPEQRALPALRVPGAPSVILVRTRKGAISPWWWLYCPRCQSRREALHKAPQEPPDAWRCTTCGRWTWASRRHGKSERSFSRQVHRRNPGHRTRERIQRERAKMMRAAAHVRRERDRLIRRERRAAERDRQALAKLLPEMLRRAKEKPMVIEATPGKRDSTRVRDLDSVVAEVCGQMERDEDMRRALAEDAEENAAVLARYSPRSRALKAQAARVLAKAAKRLGV
jgi:hypothetical protein